MSEIDKYEALVHKLAYHESIINNILDIPCNNKSVKMAAVERKIIALEELVLELPIDDVGGVFEKWRDTVSNLYCRLFLLANEKKKLKKVTLSEKIASKSSTSKEIETEASATSGAVTFSGNGQNTRKNKKRSQSATSGDDRATQTPRRSGRPVKSTYRNMNFRRSSAISAAEPVVEKDIEEQREELRVLFDGIFSKLEQVAEITVDSDLESLRLFALLVNQSIRQLIPFEDDAELQSKVLSYALPKAPQTVIDRFNNYKEAEEKEEEDADPKRPPLKGLRLLKKCLIVELTSFYEALKEALVTEDGGDSGDVVDGPLTCYFCKSNGHYKAGCPQMKNRICFRCFKRGHKAKECGRRCFKCGLMGHTKKYCKI